MTENMKNKYPHKMCIYTASMQFPTHKWKYDGTNVVFRAVEANYKKCASGLHLSPGQGLPYEFRVLPKSIVGSGNLEVEWDTNGVIPPSRVMHMLMAFPEFSEQNETLARQEFADAIVGHAQNDDWWDLQGRIRQFRDNLGYAHKAAGLVTDGLDGRGELAKYDKSAHSYCMEFNLWRRDEPTFYHSVERYRVEARFRIVHFMNSWMRIDRWHGNEIREEDFGRVFEYDKRVRVFLPERDDDKARDLLMDGIRKIAGDLMERSRNADMLADALGSIKAPKEIQ